MDQEPLDILAAAIYEGGGLRWWEAALPRVVQLEFVGVQLAVSDTSEDVPRPLWSVVLRFLDPTSAVFTIDPMSLEADWPERLRQGTIDPLGLSYEQLTFHDVELARRLLTNADVALGVVGTLPDAETWLEAPARLAFRAGRGGAVITAEAMEVVAETGAIDLGDIVRMHEAWGLYWQEYWRRRGTGDALAYDFSCEIVVPLKGSPR